jgi:two-component system chemotaxis response regulator CheY
MKMGKKILVVDDSSLMRGLAKNSLKQLKLNHVTEAEDGVEALAELKKEKYDLILSDLNMPNMDGIELLKAVRSDRDLKSIPFIIMTIKKKKESLMEALEAGLNDYLIKPVTTNDLSKKLNKVFE